MTLQTHNEAESYQKYYQSAPKWYPNGPRVPQRDPKATPKGHQGAPKARQRQPRDPQEHPPKTPKCYQMRRLSSGLRSQEMPPKRAQMVPEWTPRCRRDTLKNPPRVTKELPRHPKGTEETPRDSPKSSQMLPNATPVERIGGPRNATKVHPDGAQGGPRSYKGSPKLPTRVAKELPRPPKDFQETPRGVQKWCKMLPRAP